MEKKQIAKVAMVFTVILTIVMILLCGCGEADLTDKDESFVTDELHGKKYKIQDYWEKDTDSSNKALNRYLWKDFGSTVGVLDIVYVDDPELGDIEYNKEEYKYSEEKAKKFAKEEIGEDITDHSSIMYAGGSNFEIRVFFSLDVASREVSAYISKLEEKFNKTDDEYKSPQKIIEYYVDYSGGDYEGTVIDDADDLDIFAEIDTGIITGTKEVNAGDLEECKLKNKVKLKGGKENKITVIINGKDYTVSVLGEKQPEEEPKEDGDSSYKNGVKEEDVDLNHDGRLTSNEWKLYHDKVNGVSKKEREKRLNNKYR